MAWAMLLLLLLLLPTGCRRGGCSRWLGARRPPSAAQRRAALPAPRSAVRSSSTADSESNRKRSSSSILRQVRQAGVGRAPGWQRTSWRLAGRVHGRLAPWERGRGAVLQDLGRRSGIHAAGPAGRGRGPGAAARILGFDAPSAARGLPLARTCGAARRLLRLQRVSLRHVRRRKNEDWWGGRPAAAPCGAAGAVW
jgi:hypothetical protein